MNKDTMVGKAKQIEGRIRDAKGDLTGSPRDDMAGKARVAEGRMQEGYGKAKAAIKKATR